MNLYREAVKFRDSLFYSKKMPGHSRFKGNKLAPAARIILNEKTLAKEESGKKRRKSPEHIVAMRFDYDCGGATFCNWMLTINREDVLKTDVYRRLDVNPVDGTKSEKIKEVLEKCDCRITVAISLDGLKETHDNIRGVKGNFESVLETYKELLDLKNNHKNLKLLVNTVISNKNYKEVVKLINFVKTNMPELDGHGFDWIRGNPKDKEFGIPSLDEIKELLPMLKKTEETYLNKRKNLRDRLELGIRHYLSDLKYEIIKSNKQVIPCRAGDIFAVVYPQGDVALCELLPMIGNLREQDIKTVWNSEKAESQRQHIKDKKCHCTHGCFQPTNVMLYPKAYPKILKKLITN